MATKNSTKNNSPELKTLHNFSHKILWSRPTSYQKILAENETFTEQAQGG
jgi:hypothetical protein